jgi:predicted dinucleotide-utilizing enzyme
MTEGSPVQDAHAGRLPPNRFTVVNLLGRGKIGAVVADWLATAPGFNLNLVGRDGHAPPAPLTIDTGLRDRLQAVADQHGTRLRLFTGWITGPHLCPPGAGGLLHIEQSAPNLGPAPGLLFEGPLAQAALRFPDHLSRCP